MSKNFKLLNSGPETSGSVKDDSQKVEGFARRFVVLYKLVPVTSCAEK